MDRIEFAKTINNLTYIDIIHHFEELMILYNLIGNCTSINTITTASDDSTKVTTYSISFTDSSSAEAFNNILNNIEYPIYNEIFMVSTLMEPDSFKVLVTRK